MDEMIGNLILGPGRRDILNKDVGVLIVWIIWPSKRHLEKNNERNKSAVQAVD